MKKFLTKTGTIDSTKLKSIPDEELNLIIEKTSFLQLNPTISQRIKTIIYHPLQEHPKCVCGNYLGFSPNKGIVFKSFCSMSCAKSNTTKQTADKVKAAIEKNKLDIQTQLESCDSISIEETREFFAKHISFFKNGGSKGITVLNKHLIYKKSFTRILRFFC